jgi:hypothetical protein
VTVETGGPAFPIVVDPKQSAIEFEGMTLRDFFAAHSLPLAAGYAGGGRPETVALLAYQFADALIAVRAGRRVQADLAIEALGKIQSEISSALDKARGRS